MARLTTRQLASKRGRKKKSSKRVFMQPGDMLQNRYRIVGNLGSGGFSSVYQARDMRFENATKLCAVKEMVISVADPKVREMTIKSFEREASMLAMLDHPAIPTVSDYFTEGDKSYLILELIRGKDMEVWLDGRTEPLEQEWAIDWMIQLTDALIYLHNQEPAPVVFRDLKPSNVMMDQHNRIRLIDFNIAKLFEGAAKGTMIGTEGYCPPEQYRGISTPIGDVYALGATFHHLLTNKDPRLEPPFTFAERPIQEANSTVNSAFEALIMRCLDYNPDERFQSAAELQEALEDLSRQEILATAQIGSAAAGGAIAPTAVSSPSSAPIAAAHQKTEAFSQDIQPLWRFKCEDEIRSKAAVDQNLIFVGAYDNNLYAIELKTGEFVWKYPTTDGVGSSPYVYKDTVYIGSSDNNLYAISIKDGRQRWRFTTGGSIYSSPIVKFDHVFVGSDDGNFYAVNSKTGKMVWKSNAFGPVRSTPFVADEFLYFGTEGGYIFSLNLSNGAGEWQTQAKRAVTSSPTVADDIVFAGSIDSTVYALDASSGWAIWKHRTRRPIISSPAVHDGAVYVGSSDGQLYALDMNSGHEKWQFETTGQISSSPVVWNDAVYFGSTDGYIYSLELKKGKLRWKYKTGGQVISSPIIVKDVLYVGSTDHYLYALPV